MIDARRMEVYTALYRYTADGLQALSAIESRVIVDDSWPAVDATENLYYFGDGAEKCCSLLENDRRHYLPDILPEAQHLMVKGKGLMVKGADIAYYEPFYLKEFQAAPSHVKGLT